ncbi:hypothetical protein IFM89_014652 [Coptis chinensis]|uniref:Uncharacterized protein n=1 Tax=Coptis chinensis TaxID=261450 RepID=A0A835H4B7_9MAGN|nr:hypothetical protein IFM89_014652 [Coptis chinensis]
MELSARPFLCQRKMNCPVDNNVFHPLLQVQLARTLTNAKQRFERLERPLARKRIESGLLLHICTKAGQPVMESLPLCSTPRDIL